MFIHCFAGATGGVGKRVVGLLVAQGRKVRALVRDVDKAKELLVRGELMGLGVEGRGLGLEWRGRGALEGRVDVEVEWLWEGVGKRGPTRCKMTCSARRFVL